MMSFEQDSSFAERKEDKSRMEELQKKKKSEEEAELKKAEEATGIIVMPKVVFRKLYGTANKVEVIEFEGIEKVENAVVLEGIPGSNLTAVVSTGYLCKQLKLPIVGVMRVPSLTAQGVVVQSVPYQSVRIYGNEKLVVIQSELPIQKGAMVHNLISAILDFCGRHSSKMLITVEGIPTKPTDLKDADRLRFVTTDEAFSKHMKEKNHLAIVNGIIGGVTGQLLADAPLADPPLRGVSAVMAKVDARLPSAESAVHVVRALNDYLEDATVDLTDLENSAFELEHALQDAMKKAKASMGGAASGEKPPSSMYM